MIHTYFINNTRWLEEVIAEAWHEMIIIARALRSLSKTASQVLVPIGREGVVCAACVDEGCVIAVSGKTCYCHLTESLKTR